MRLRLCEAALEMLCKVGYERLSMNVIVAQARASRGAQTHHFPTKVDLLVGAFEHLLMRWENSHRAFLAAQPRPIALDTYLRHLWLNVFSKPTYVGAVELMLAARSDEVLRERLHGVLAEWMKFRSSIWQQIIGLPSATLSNDTFQSLNLCMLRGMAIHASFNADDSVNNKLLEAWIVVAIKVITPDQALARELEQAAEPPR
ncbi:helix-turn-helix domain-containing protein [Bosea sp. 685]|uniref:TetR/AcrR family transcriptional regulator n=1 Tax=Bosea sp. 685 TaxID=3080057 RepID=UPI002892DF2D|nr:helix-turn-helix domain-containing protein [Bosea sp. 685]WNJ91200.1 helix-turn-helix domain-containing protein [Bosea sp. 685]